jgi:hypothetical protein
VLNIYDAMIFINAQSSSRPFNGCTQLYLEAAHGNLSYPAVCLDYAQQWTALEHLELCIPATPQLQQWQLEQMPGVLSRVGALRGLRSLLLTVPRFDASSGGNVGQLKQLTALTVAVGHAAAGVPQDLVALSGLRNLRHPGLAPSSAAGSRTGGALLPPCQPDVTAH